MKWVDEENRPNNYDKYEVKKLYRTEEDKVELFDIPEFVELRKMLEEYFKDG
jgi:hypothetical protein